MLNTKEDILKNTGNQTADGPLSFFPYYGSKWGPTNVWIFKISFLFNIRKKLIQVWNDMAVSKRQFSFLGELFL